MPSFFFDFDGDDGIFGKSINRNPGRSRHDLFSQNKTDDPYSFVSSTCIHTLFFKFFIVIPGLKILNEIRSIT